MLMTIATLLAVHCAALAAVLAASRDAVLVDETGRSVDRASAWQARVLAPIRIKSGV